MAESSQLSKASGVEDTGDWRPSALLYQNGIDEEDLHGEISGDSVRRLQRCRREREEEEASTMNDGESLPSSMAHLQYGDYLESDHILSDHIETLEDLTNAVTALKRLGIKTRAPVSLLPLVRFESDGWAARLDRDRTTQSLREQAQAVVKHFHDAASAVAAPMPTTDNAKDWLDVFATIYRSGNESTADGIAQATDIALTQGSKGLREFHGEVEKVITSLRHLAASLTNSDAKDCIAIKQILDGWLADPALDEVTSTVDTSYFFGPTDRKGSKYVRRVLLQGRANRSTFDAVHWYTGRVGRSFNILCQRLADCVTSDDVDSSSSCLAPLAGLRYHGLPHLASKLSQVARLRGISPATIPVVFPIVEDDGAFPLPGEIASLEYWECDYADNDFTEHIEDRSGKLVRWLPEELAFAKEQMEGMREQQF